MWARHVLAPLDQIAAYVPRCGEILDVGCGYGLFSNALALEEPRRSVVALDPAGPKVAAGRRAGRSLPNVRYLQGTIDAARGGSFDAITVLDVLYLLPPAEKRYLLACCRELLKPGGVLLLKTNDTRPRWKFLVTWLQEAIMTRSGLTLGRGLHFYSEAQHRALLCDLGFEVQVVRLDGWWPYPHLLFICRPAGGGQRREGGP